MIDSIRGQGWPAVVPRVAGWVLLGAGILLAPGPTHAIEVPPSPPGSAVDSTVIDAGTPSTRVPAASDSLGLQPAAPPPGGGPPSGSRIARIRASGFANVDSMVIIRTFGLKVGDDYSTESVREGVRRLFQSGLYTDVNVVDTIESNGVLLTVVVQERPRIKGIRFDGLKKLEESKVKEKLTSAVGVLLDRGTLDLDAAKIVDSYAEEGYAHARVTPRVEPGGPGSVQVIFGIDEGEKVKVRGIEVHGTRGNRSFQPEDLAEAMKSRTPGFLKSGVYKPSNTQEDETKIRLYMRSRGFKDAEVDSIRPVFTPDGKGVVLHVYVREGARYRFGTVRWTGNVTIPTPALESGTVVRQYLPYSEPQISKTLEGAYTLYQEQGFLYLSIEPRFTERDSTVDVEFVVQEGIRSRIADLQIAGNTRTKENVIRREASVRPGDVFRRSTLMRTQRDIFGLGFFQDVTVDYEPTGDSADINLTLKVQEKQTGTASAGAGFASSTGLTGFLELGHNNLFGNGQSVNIHLERGGKRSAFEISFTDPWYRDTPLTLGFSLFNTSRELDYYDRRDVGGGVRVGRPVPWPDFTRGLVSYDLRNVTLSDFLPPRPGEPSNLASLRNTDWPRLVSSITLTFTRISTDNPFYPSRGSKFLWSNTFAGGVLGGVEEFYKGTFDVKNYSRLQGPLVLMLRGRTGFLGGKFTPDYERFRLGGTTIDYVRGYPDYYIVPRANVSRDPLTGQVVERYPGGRKMLIAGAEVQFPIADPLHGLFFFEAGNTWNSTREIDLGDLRRSVGFGVRFEVPALGRIGFDLGYGLDREEGAGWKTHFQLGNTL